MTHKQINVLRQLLFAQRDALRRSSTAVLGEAIFDSEIVRLASLDLALERIERGTFGFCAECGESMSFEQLHATPEDTCCLCCQHEGRAASRLLH